jgi:CDP-glycerol glycerophosphotransferase
MGKSFNDSPKVIYDYLISHSAYQKYHCIWAFEDPSHYPELESVKIDTIPYFLTALRAKYWITNTNIERGLQFKKNEQKYLNTWHGIPLKYVGNDVSDRHDFNFGKVDFICVNGQYDEQIFKRAFQAKEESILRTGLPRNEELWNVTSEQKNSIRKKLGLPEEKTVILYAPTWRESFDGGKSYTLKPPIDFNKWKKELGDGYIILFRAHHQTTKIMGIGFDEYVRNCSDYPAVNDLMIASDLLVTDYSSIAFDYSILCRPILIYAYDYDTYLAERGTYFQIDEKYPNKSCRTEEELIEMIQKINFEEESKKTFQFRENFVKYGIGATEACVKAEFNVI